MLVTRALSVLFSLSALPPVFVPLSLIHLLLGFFIYKISSFSGLEFSVLFFLSLAETFVKNRRFFLSIIIVVIVIISVIIIACVCREVIL